MTWRTFRAVMTLELKRLARAWRFWIALVPVVVVAQVLVANNASFVSHFGSWSQLFTLGVLAIGAASAVSSGASMGPFAASRPTSPRLVLGARLTAYVGTAAFVFVVFMLLASRIDGAFDSVRRSSNWSQIGLRAATDEVRFDSPESERCFRAAEEEFPGAAMACGGLLNGVARTAAGAKPLVRWSDLECLERWRGSTPECEEALEPLDSNRIGGAALADLEIDRIIPCYPGDLDEPERCRALADLLNESTTHHATYPKGELAGQCIDLLIWLRSTPDACPSPHIEATTETAVPAWFVGMMLLGVLLAAVCVPMVIEPKSSARGWVAWAVGITLLWLMLPQDVFPFPMSPWTAVAAPFALAAASVGFGLIHVGQAEFSAAPGARSTWRRLGWTAGFWVLAALFVVAVAGAVFALMMFE